jgi:putative Mg2+ transporter-C (MgtC) family protein
MNVFLEELTGGLPDGAQLARIIIRLVAAAVLGAVIGLEREWLGKPAGLRTHMLVSLGAALFVVACLEFEMSPSDLSRVIQGLATGVGFLGAGAILKRAEEREITGLTTAAGIWLTAAVGVAVGLGRLGSAILAVLLTWVILSVLGRLEGHMDNARKKQPPLP